MQYPEMKDAFGIEEDVRHIKWDATEICQEMLVYCLIAILMNPNGNAEIKYVRI